MRVAVVGSGPAGIYATEALLRRDDVSVDIVDALPTPYGLVRYGVAPDHLKIKSIQATLHEVLSHPRARFIGNVTVGRDVRVDELRAGYNAVVYSCGAASDRHLDIPGEDLPGSMSATDFVSWYCGHPDARLRDLTLQARSVVVIGLGNVAVDVARILARAPEELAHTDIADHALAVLRRAAVRDVTIVGRRSVADAKFTTKELRELGQLDNADIVVDPDDLVVDEAGERRSARDANVRRNVDLVNSWAHRPLQNRPRRIALRFLLRPFAIVGAESVTAMRFERMRLDGSGGVVGTGDYAEIPAQLVLRSVGYRGDPLPGVPFDETSGTIPNDGGRVLRDGRAAAGEYVAGWIKRGPSGVIGTNRSDAVESVRALLADADAGSLPTPQAVDLPAVLRSRGVQLVEWQGWLRIDAAEISLGDAQGRPRARISDRGELLAAATS